MHVMLLDCFRMPGRFWLCGFSPAAVRLGVLDLRGKTSLNHFNEDTSSSILSCVGVNKQGGNTGRGFPSFCVLLNTHFSGSKVPIYEPSVLSCWSRTAFCSDHQSYNLKHTKNIYISLSRSLDVTSYNLRSWCKIKQTLSKPTGLSKYQRNNKTKIITCA